MLDGRFGPGLISISPDDKSRRCLRSSMIYLLVNVQLGKVKFVFVIFSDKHLKIKMNEELRKKNNKEKTISIKNDILNDFLSGMVDKHLI